MQEVEQRRSSCREGKMLKSRRLGMLFMPTCWLNVGRNKAIQARSARWRFRRVRAVCRKRLFSLTLEKPYSCLPAGNAWLVYFGYGDGSFDYEGDDHAVRLVRGGQ